MRQIILDTETTGLKVEEGHRLIEIGCIELFNRKFTGNTYHVYLNPQRDIDAGAMAVHGITNEFLKDKPFFEHTADEFLDFISNSELIIHNAPFDVGFINHEFRLLARGLKPLHEHCQITDTLQIARKLHVGQRNNLDALCKRYKIDNSKREFHGALLDAHLLAQVYLAMTGGQGSFFEESPTEQSMTPVHSIEASTTTDFKKHNLIVIKADESECLAHEKYLDLLKKQGKCLWNE